MSQIAGGVGGSGGAGGNVVGPASAVNNDFAAFDGTTGKLIKDSGFTSSSFLPASALTQFDVLVGGAANAIVSVGPGSAGQVLQSGGNAANPVYSTATYPATATGTGTILRADGTNWSATTATYPNTVTSQNLMFASASNVVGGLSNPSLPSPYILWDGTSTRWMVPGQDIWLYDDFVGTIVNSALQWTNTVGGTASIVMQASAGITSGHPGVVQLNCGGAFASAAIELAAGGSLPFLLGGGRILMNFVVKLGSLSAAANRNTILIGFNDVFSATSGNNAVYFTYVDNVNSGNWQCVTVAGGVATTSTTSTAADTNYHRFTIDINAAASSVTFYIDGSSVATNAAHIPTLATTPAVVVANGGTYSSGSQAVYVDMFSLQQTLTTPR